MDIQSFDARAFRACLGPRTVLHAVLGVAREVLAELECEGKELPGIRWKWPNCARQQLGTMLAFKASTLTHKNDVGTQHAHTDHGVASSMPVVTVSVGRKRFGLDAHLASPSHASS